MSENHNTNLPSKIYTHQDLVKFSDPNLYSGFGNPKDSKKPSAPKFSFGTATRASQPKRFQSHEMCRIDCYGRQTPKGPNYDVTDKYSYSKVPQCKIGSEPRNIVRIKPKYDHYLRKDIDIDINQADKNTRTNLANTKFGGQSRFPLDEKNYKRTPGPEYNPPIHPEGRSTPRFSLYARRSIKGYDPLKQLTSTSNIVGPGAYYPQKSGHDSTKIGIPKYSLPKGPRIPIHKPEHQMGQLNQTYDLTSSMGNQNSSGKISKPAFSIGKTKRGEGKSAVFSAHMEFKPASVNMNHPRF